MSTVNFVYEIPYEIILESNEVLLYRKLCAYHPDILIYYLI